jgi:hypothetical protein
MPLHGRVQLKEQTQSNGWSWSRDAFRLQTVVNIKLFVIFLAFKSRVLRFLSLLSNQEAIGYEIRGVKVVRSTNTERIRS